MKEIIENLSRIHLQYGRAPLFQSTKLSTTNTARIFIPMFKFLLILLLIFVPFFELSSVLRLYWTT